MNRKTGTNHRLNRRSFLDVLAALGLVRPSAPTQYGEVDIYRWRDLAAKGIRLHVYHEGRDVTNRCYFVDDTSVPTRAHLWKENAEGRRYLDRETHTAAHEWVFGVVIKPEA